MSRFVSRRTLLRGAGVALSLPWLESLAPRQLHAQTADIRRRFLPIYLPNGAPEFWTPTSDGSGDAWRLGSILDPFGASLKSKLNVLTNLENGSVFNSDGTSQVDPAHGRLSGAWLTCVDAAAVRAQLGLDEANGISVDQVLAQDDAFKGKTPLASLQVGLSTALGSCDTEPCSNSQSVSWAVSAGQRQFSTLPMYKLVNPLEVFNQLVALAPQMDPSGTAALEAKKRLARNKSVLDAVLENATRTRARLGTSDKARMDEFLESVRAVEQRVVGVSSSMGGLGCMPQTPISVDQSAQPRHNTATYNKGDHADAMNALIVMAFQCDATRVISYMLEDERSEFTYDNVPERAFTAEDSTPKGGFCPEYHTAQHLGGDDFASITWWNVGKVADLCRTLDSIQEAPGVSVLDNTVVFLGACMHGGDHRADRLPVALIGGGNLGLKNDQHLTLDKRPLRDLYFTLMNDVYGLDVGMSDFGQDLTGAAPAKISELLKG